MLAEGEHDLFLLALVLLVLAYFAGFTSDVGAVKDAGIGLINVATGRNAQGQFANYPGGGGGGTPSGGSLK